MHIGLFNFITLIVSVVKVYLRAAVCAVRVCAGRCGAAGVREPPAAVRTVSACLAAVCGAGVDVSGGQGAEIT